MTVLPAAAGAGAAASRLKAPPRFQAGTWVYALDEHGTIVDVAQQVTDATWHEDTYWYALTSTTTRQPENRLIVAPAPGVPAQHTPLDRALGYIARGWAPIPVPSRKKAPVLKGWQRLRIGPGDAAQYFSAPQQNIGVLLGEPSAGLVDIDLDTPAAVTLGARWLPATGAAFGRASKRRSHYLYVVAPALETVKYQDIEERDSTGTHKVNMLVEVRSTGTQTIFPGSTHPTGELIEWDSLAPNEPAPIDGQLLHDAAARVAAGALLVAHWPSAGSRQDTALALAAVLLRGGWAVDDVAAFLSASAALAHDPESVTRASAAEYTAKRLALGGPATGWKRLAELLGSRVADRLRSWLGLREPDPIVQELLTPLPGAASAPSTNGVVQESGVAGLAGLVAVPSVLPIDGALPEAQVPVFHTTDWGNAQRLVRRYGHDLRYCFEWESWLVWDGCRWAKDRTGEVLRLAKATVARITDEAVQASDEDTQKRLHRHRFDSEARSRLTAMVDLASSEPGIPVTSDALDADPWVLNCQNGTVDLRTGDLHTHARHELLTKLAPVPYDLSAESPLWNVFLAQTLPDPDVRAFVQRAAGYSLAGVTPEHLLLVLWGSGRNGKSVFLETVRAAVGEYSLVTPTQTLLTKPDGAIPNDVARLKGARFVSATETGDYHRLDEALVKQLTGGDSITARFMRGEFFEFRPEFTLWFSTNHKPVVHGTDPGIWSRIKLVPFTVQFWVPPASGTDDLRADPSLTDRLRRELPGVLAWLVQGCLLWQSVGLDPPTAVSAATETYRQEMDVLGDFLAECCLVTPQATVTANVLYARYVTWAQAANEKPISHKRFSSQLSERGFVRERDASTRFWRGLMLQPVPAGVPAGVPLSAVSP